MELTVNTSRGVLAEITERGWQDELAAAGVVVVTDTCTYLSPALMRDPTGITMTNSAKWAYYAPGNLGGRVVYGSMRDCVESARAGRVVRTNDVTDPIRAVVLVPGPGIRPGPRAGRAAQLLGRCGSRRPASIIEPRHPDVGRCVAGQVLAMPAVRGSSSSSSILAELLRLGVGPSAIVLGEPDEILVVGALAASELYGSTCPVVLLDPATYAIVVTFAKAEIALDGTITGT